MWKLFFPDGPEGDDYVLLRVRPTHLEVMNFAQHITPPPFGLQHANLIRTDEGWQLV